MSRDDIIAKIKAQNFPLGSYVVFGSGPLAAAGIRPTNDIDLVVSSSLYLSLQQRGWRFKADPEGNPMLTQGEFGVSKKWCTGPCHVSFDDLYVSAEVIDGVAFANLQEVINWKRFYARSKDLEDLVLIEEHLSKVVAR